MQTPTPVNIEAMLMNVPSSTPARAPGLTLTVQAKNQVNTVIAPSSWSARHMPFLLISCHRIIFSAVLYAGIPATSISPTN